MAELVDAGDLKSPVRMDVGVRVPFWAYIIYKEVFSVMTSAELNKQLKQLQIKRRQILSNEEDVSKFVAATTEDVEAVRPEYNYRFTKLDLDVVESNIRELKHRINVFNTTYMIPELGMTIDQVLVFLPMLTEKVNKLRKMAGALEKRRISNYGARANLIEYEYTNYDIDEIKQDYDLMSKKLADIQIALDKANTTVDV